VDHLSQWSLGVQSPVSHPEMRPPPLEGAVGIFLSLGAGTLKTLPTALRYFALLLVKFRRSVLSDVTSLHNGFQY
jgi:hypothetical protein